MDTQNLRTFVALSKQKNFTQTAKQLFVAQSTVTNRIAELEKEIGKKLFTRDKKNIELTNEGAMFLSFAQRMIDLEETSINQINSSSKYTKHFRIGATNSIYDCHLFPAIDFFLKEHTDIASKVSIAHSSELLQLLQDGLLDVAFSFLPLTKQGYECIIFHSDELVLLTSSKNTKYINGINKEELTNINYIICNFALHEVGQYIKSLFPPYYQFSFEIDNSTKVLPYLLEGIGYSFLPRKMVEPYLDNKELITIPLLDFETPIINSYCIGKKSCKDLWEQLLTMDS